MNWGILAVQNIQRIYDELQDIRQLPGDLRWIGRIPSVFSLDEEIMARYTGRVLVADIIADDGKAVLRQPNPLRLTQTKIPNLKHGEGITQSMMHVLQRIEAGNANRRDNDIFEDYVARRTIELRLGVYQRMEVLLVAMLLDSFSYDRLGIKISGQGWQMPSDLKVTVGTVWSNTASTPIQDILAVRNVARYKYGMDLDRVTITTADLVNMVKTTEFQSMATPFLVGLSLHPIPIFANNTDQMLNLAGSVLGMTFELDDRQTWTEDNYGAQNAARVLPTGKVILTATQADNNSRMWDWANGEIMETAPGMVPSLIGSFDGSREGPVGYVTASDPQGNPPGLNMWAVGRGFPRRHMEAASSVLTVA